MLLKSVLRTRLQTFCPFGSSKLRSEGHIQIPSNANKHRKTTEKMKMKVLLLGKSKWGLSNGGLRPLSAICTQSSTIVHFCGLFAPLSKGKFRYKTTTIVGNRGQLWTTTLSPHLLSPHLDFPDSAQCTTSLFWKNGLDYRVFWSVLFLGASFGSPLFSCVYDLFAPDPWNLLSPIFNTSSIFRGLWGFYRGPPTIYCHRQKTSDQNKGFQRGWCTNCQNVREQHNVHHPQDCTGDFHHGFRGGGARIAGFDFNTSTDSKPKLPPPSPQPNHPTCPARLWARLTSYTPEPQNKWRDSKMTPKHSGLKKAHTPTTEITTKIIRWELFYVMAGTSLHRFYVKMPKSTSPRICRCNGQPHHVHMKFGIQV